MRVYKISYRGGPFVPLTEAPADVLALTLETPDEKHGDQSDEGERLPLSAFREQAGIVPSLKQRGLLP